MEYSIAEIQEDEYQKMMEENEDGEPKEIPDEYWREDNVTPETSTTVPFEGKVTEKDPDGKNPHEPGAKLDDGKRKLYTHLICYFPRALEAVCEVSEVGARKYTRDGWKSVDNGEERYADADVRHMFAEAKGELVDFDTKLYHSAQKTWNSLAKLELMLRDIEQRQKMNDRQAQAFKASPE